MVCELGIHVVCCWFDVGQSMVDSRHSATAVAVIAAYLYKCTSYAGFASYGPTDCCGPSEVESSRGLLSGVMCLVCAVLLLHFSRSAASGNTDV
jgi:hypothetical protein